MCHAYYQKVYTTMDPPSVVEEVQTYSLKYLEDRISDGTKKSLSAPITMEELHKAMKEMANGK